MGKELALRYASRGCRLVIGARRLEELEKVRQMCIYEFENESVIPVQTDVTKEDDAKKLIDTAVREFGGVDLLVLCAGISAHSKFEDFEDMAPFKQVVETNLYGCVYPAKYALKWLKRPTGNNKGQIVVISSYSGEFGLPHRSAYCASKFAVNGFFESLRMEVGDKVDITVVSPITVQTEFRNYSLIKPDKKADEGEAGSTMSAKEAVDQIIKAADFRMEKFVFPFKPWLGF
jgi:NAD(P)-dependent dehydrogenase (short-subunit alcohol dehydrogenase family)